MSEHIRQYWNNRPCNIRHSSKSIGTIEYFDEVEARKYYVEPHIPAFAEFHRWKDKTVLEIGCGIGTDTINFARAGAKVTAVELSDVSMSLAEVRAHMCGMENNIAFVRCNAEDFNGWEAYHLVYSFGVLHHADRPDKILQRMWDHSDRYTEVKLMLYNKYSWKVAHLLLTKGPWHVFHLTKFVARYSEAQSGCPVTHIYSRRQARKFVRSVGFEVVSLTVDHIFPYSIFEYKRHLYKRVWYFRWMPRFLFRALERMFGWHMLITAKMKEE